MGAFTGKKEEEDILIKLTGTSKRTPPPFPHFLCLLGHPAHLKRSSEFFSSSPLLKAEETSTGGGGGGRGGGRRGCHSSRGGLVG